VVEEGNKKVEVHMEVALGGIPEVVAEVGRHFAQVAVCT
jgi:hypothetical protein